MNKAETKKNNKKNNFLANELEIFRYFLRFIFVEDEIEVDKQNKLGIRHAEVEYITCYITGGALSVWFLVLHGFWPLKLSSDMLHIFYPRSGDLHLLKRCGTLSSNLFLVQRKERVLSALRNPAILPKYFNNTMVKVE